MKILVLLCIAFDKIFGVGGGFLFCCAGEDLAKLGNDCVAAVQAYDSAMESTEALNAAELKLQDIINSPSLDAACKKIDDLALKNQLDSTLVLMITKAWSAAKESNMTKDEVKYKLPLALLLCTEVLVVNFHS